MEYRTATTGDLPAILDVFKATVLHICEPDYTGEQLNAWAGAAVNQQKWVDRIEMQYFLVAENSEGITGFGSLENGEYLDVLYIHEQYQRKGIARAILGRLEDRSRLLKKSHIRADVSITARPFFEKHGFRVIKLQFQMVNKIRISNYSMVKDLYST